MKIKQLSHATEGKIPGMAFHSTYIDPDRHHVRISARCRRLPQALHNGNGVGAPDPVGFKNYVDILSGSQFYLLLKNNFVFLLFIPIQIVIGTMIAVFINDEVPGWRVYRVVYYIPQVISAVIVGYLFMVMFGYEGPVNLLLKGLGVIEESIGWLENGTTARIVVLICLVWVYIGWQSLLSLGGLASIPPSLYEAAKLDGAGYWKRLFKITFPMLGRTVDIFVYRIGHVGLHGDIPVYLRPYGRRAGIRKRQRSII